MDQEEKNRLADQKMLEMKRKNEAWAKRYEEIEADKKNANLASKMANMKLNGPNAESAPKVANVGDVSSKNVRISGDREPKRKREPPAKIGNVPRRSADGSLNSSADFVPPPDPKFSFLNDPERFGSSYENAYGERIPPLFYRQEGRDKTRGGGGGEDVVRSPHDSQANRNAKSTAFTPGGMGRGARSATATPPSPSKRQMEMSMTGKQRASYKAWLTERQKIDADRLARQRTGAGGWRREWDSHKHDGDNDADNRMNSRTGPHSGGYLTPTKISPTNASKNASPKYQRDYSRRSENRRPEHYNNQSGEDWDAKIEKESRAAWNNTKATPTFRQITPLRRLAGSNQSNSSKRTEAPHVSEEDWDSESAQISTIDKNNNSKDAPALNKGEGETTPTDQSADDIVGYVTADESKQPDNRETTESSSVCHSSAAWNGPFCFKITSPTKYGSKVARRRLVSRVVQSPKSKRIGQLDASPKTTDQSEAGALELNDQSESVKGGGANDDEDELWEDVEDQEGDEEAGEFEDALEVSRQGDHSPARNADDLNSPKMVAESQSDVLGNSKAS